MEEEGKRYSFLIIDDDPEIHSILEVMLSFWGFETIPAYDAYEGIAAAIKRLPVAIILDIEMPEINGPKTLKLLKTIDITKNIPVIVLSGSLDPKRIKYMMSLGAADFLSKPFSHEVFYERVISHLPRKIIEDLKLETKKKF